MANMQTATSAVTPVRRAPVARSRAHRRRDGAILRAMFRKKCEPSLTEPNTNSVSGDAAKWAPWTHESCR